MTIVEEAFDRLTLARPKIAVSEARQSLGEGLIAILAGFRQQRLSAFLHGSREVARAG